MGLSVHGNEGTAWLIDELVAKIHSGFGRFMEFFVFFFVGENKEHRLMCLNGDKHLKVWSPRGFLLLIEGFFTFPGLQIFGR